MSGVPSREYGDASLYYRIEESATGIIRIDERCHVCSFNALGPGKSLVFAIDRNYVSRDALLRIKYSFRWEQHPEDGAGSISTHSVEFYFARLPKTVLPSTGAVQHLVGCERRGVFCNLIGAAMLE